LAEDTHQLNQSQAPRLAKWILARLPKGGTAGVLGLSYKPNTEVIEESQGLALARHLLSVGVPVVVYDPAAMENARSQLSGKVTFAASAADCARQADVLAITTPWAEFRDISPNDFKSHGTVLDCWRLLDKAALGAAVEYLALGLGLGQPESSAEPVPAAAATPAA
jgi:UDPglucose 6-dehydrogenase